MYICDCSPIDADIGVATVGDAEAIATVTTVAKDIF